jgi:hypothetical protein
MPQMKVVIETDKNGYFSKTINYDPPGPFELTVRLAATLLSPFATAVRGELGIDSADGTPSNQKKAFVAWHSEQVQIGSWRLAGGNNIIVLTGRTRPKRANAQLVVLIDATV